MHNMNYGKVFTWASVVLCLGSCIGYAAQGDVRRSAYFFFAACITATVAL
jgi:hypothetical protein